MSPRTPKTFGKDWANRKGLALSCALETRHVRQGQAAPIGCCGERPDVAEAYCLGGRRGSFILRVQGLFRVYSGSDNCVKGGLENRMK